MFPSKIIKVRILYIHSYIWKAVMN